MIELSNSQEERALRLHRGALVIDAHCDRIDQFMKKCGCHHWERTTDMPPSLHLAVEQIQLHHVFCVEAILVQELLHARASVGGTHTDTSRAYVYFPLNLSRSMITGQ